MAKKKPVAKATKRSLLPVSYETSYTLVLQNNGDGYAGCTFGVLVELIDNAIADIDNLAPGLVYDLPRFQALLVIREQLRVEYHKYDEGRA